MYNIHLVALLAYKSKLFFKITNKICKNYGLYYKIKEMLIYGVKLRLLIHELTPFSW